MILPTVVEIHAELFSSADAKIKATRNVSCNTQANDVRHGVLSRHRSIADLNKHDSQQEIMPIPKH